MTHPHLAFLLLLQLVLPGCPRTDNPVKVASVPETSKETVRPWKADVTRLPSGSTAQGTVQLNRYFPLFQAFGRHRGRDAAMSAWQIPHQGRTWWAVDTRYRFPTEDDAARFLASQQAQLAEGHPLVEARLTLPCDPAARLFAGRIVHPGLNTPFLALVVIGRHQQHVFKFLAAVEMPDPEPATDAQPAEELLRADFISLATMALAP